jgi:uncharacterized protein YkwD
MGVRNRLAAVMVAALMGLAMWSTNASASASCPGDEVPPTEATAYDSVMTLVCDINEFRARNGLRPLSWDWRLWYGAQNHAADMAARHYFAHVSPEGHGLGDRIAPTGYIPPAGGWTVSENLGFGTMMLSSPLAITVGWLNSEVHRENMLDPEVDNIGVGLGFGPVADGEQSGTIYVADFGHREEPVAAPKPSVAATEVPARTTRPRSKARKFRFRERAGRTGRR